jgi:diadenylate cyclase
MDYIYSLAATAISYLSTIRVSDVVDIAIVAYVIYQILVRLRSTTSARVLKGIVVLLIILWLSSIFNLKSVNFLMSTAVEWGVLALIVLFQPEIRRFLEKLGSSKFSMETMLGRAENASGLERCIMQVVLACTEMSKSRTGALIVFERTIRLDDVLRSGTKLDAEVSNELIKNIFFVKAPMHDGAAIIRDGRLLGAGCMLPLSRNVNLSRDLGMRHRAGIGMSENSDAVVVLVSEETGSISVAVGGMLKRHLSSETLEKLLRNELLPHTADEGGRRERRFRPLGEVLKARKDVDSDGK